MPDGTDAKIGVTILSRNAFKEIRRQKFFSGARRP